MVLSTSSQPIRCSCFGDGGKIKSVQAIPTTGAAATATAAEVCVTSQQPESESNGIATGARVQRKVCF